MSERLLLVGFVPYSPGSGIDFGRKRIVSRHISRETRRHLSWENIQSEHALSGVVEQHPGQRHAGYAVQYVGQYSLAARLSATTGGVVCRSGLIGVAPSTTPLPVAALVALSNSWMI